MFFEDKPGSLREMIRVLRPGGRLAVAVCDTLDHSPGYDALASLLQRLFGPEVADSFRAPFALGDPDRFLALAHEANITAPTVNQHDGTVRFESIDAMISTERACIWTLGGLLDDDQFEVLLREARRDLRPFIGEDDAVVFSMPALILTAAKA